MATVAAIEPRYSSHFTEIIEICSHCGRPLCPHCWNHTNLDSKTVDLWECSNHTCKLEFHYYNSENK